MQPICTIRRAAEVLGVSRQRVDQLVEAGRLTLAEVEPGEGEAAPRLLYVPQVEALAAQDRPPGNPAWRAAKEAAQHSV